MKILGVDASTHTGVAVVGSACTVCGVQDTKVLQSKLRDFERVIDLQTEFTQFIGGNGLIDYAIIEGFAYGNTHTLAMLVEITTALKLVLYDKRIPFVLVAPTSLKKFITGSGKASKEQMRVCLHERFGIVEKNNNIVDALCLAIMGAYAYNCPDLPVEVITPQLRKLAMDIVCCKGMYFTKV